MRVKGFEVTHEVAEQVIERMRERRFGTAELASLVLQHDHLMRFESVNKGVDTREIASSIANHIVQIERKVGNIRQIERSVWEWCAPEGARAGIFQRFLR
jgi:Glu-tRNA(Gln) amidotransferase subunit E-like FAD-binding protein